jgi:hypothetical protein
MARDKRWYVEEAQYLIEMYAELRKDQYELDKIARLEWRLPQQLEEVGRLAVKTTSPNDAIKAGARVLSVLDEKVEIDPATVAKKTDTVKAKEKANLWESVLKWQFELASRRKSILRQDITRSALMYDEVCMVPIHLPSQIKNIRALGGNPARQEAALRNGQYAVAIKNPQTVYTRYSDYGPEAVLHATVMRPKQIVDFWGGNASELKSLLDGKKAEKDYVLYDYVDYDKRYVWCAPGNEVSPSGDMEGDRIDILFTDRTQAWLPWVCVIGGTNLDGNPENQREPLLWGTMKAGLVDTANIIGSLMLNEVIATASQPRLKKMGPDPDAIEIDYTDATGEVDVPPGHDVDVLQQQGVSPALRELYDNVVNDLQGNTIPRILVTAEAAPGEPFSGYNLRIQQAIASLMPWKQLAERGMSAMFRHMLYWAEDSGTNIEGPTGESILARDINPKRIHLSVELTPYEPLDEQQKVNTAVMASRDIKGLPAAEILSMMNITDPQTKIKTWAKEQFYWTMLQGQLEKMRMQVSGEIEQMAMEMAQGIVQEQMQALQGPQNPGDQAAPGAPPGMPAVEGQGFNPNAGGRVPAEAFPAANVREMQMGQTRLGEEITGV